jgi:hypothetical protein
MGRSIPSSMDRPTPNAATGCLFPVVVFFGQRPENLEPMQPDEGRQGPRRCTARNPDQPRSHAAAPDAGTRGTVGGGARHGSHTRSIRNRVAKIRVVQRPVKDCLMGLSAVLSADSSGQCASSPTSEVSRASWSIRISAGPTRRSPESSLEAGLPMLSTGANPLTCLPARTIHDRIRQCTRGRSRMGLPRVHGAGRRNEDQP